MSSVSYSFKDVSVNLIVGSTSDLFSLPLGLSAGVPVTLSKPDFFGKEGVINVLTNSKAIDSSHKDVEGNILWDISNDMSGQARIRVGDMSTAYDLLSVLYSMHQLGYLIGKLYLNITQTPVGQATLTGALTSGSSTTSNTVTGISAVSSIEYSCSKGTIVATPGKSWGAKQTGTEFVMDFQSVDGGLSLTSNITQYLT